jgi:pimeloyl-ACP methyl ester carboxylesterase
MMRLRVLAVLLLWGFCCGYATAQAATPALPAGAAERAVTFATDGLSAPGILTLPAPGARKPPIAVLVAGSGVQDRDGTVGPNKFLQQLAWGLAARGVATLRFDRRAKFAMASFLAHPDLDHEVVIDAANALAYVATLPEVDAHAIFLVGHSLGAQLAPDVVAMRLKQAPGSVCGMALLSGVARPIDGVMAEQIQTLGKNQGGTPEQIAPVLKAWNDVWLQAKDPSTPADKPLGVSVKLPAMYWRDWLRRDPVAMMKKLDVPAFVSRGTKDVNSTQEDFVLMAQAPHVTAMEFPGLNHLYMPNPGVANGMDMLKPGVVSPEFLDALAAWMMKTAGR